MNLTNIENIIYCIKSNINGISINIYHGVFVYFNYYIHYNSEYYNTNIFIIAIKIISHI